MQIKVKKIIKIQILKPKLTTLELQLRMMRNCHELILQNCLNRKKKRIIIKKRRIKFQINSAAMACQFRKEKILTKQKRNQQLVAV